jgi:hypothetical protein
MEHTGGIFRTRKTATVKRMTVCPCGNAEARGLPSIIADYPVSLPGRQRGPASPTSQTADFCRWRRRFRLRPASWSSGVADRLTFRTSFSQRWFAAVRPTLADVPGCVIRAKEQERARLAFWDWHTRTFQDVLSLAEGRRGARRHQWVLGARNRARRHLRIRLTGTPGRGFAGGDPGGSGAPADRLRRDGQAGP